MDRLFKYNGDLAMSLLSSRHAGKKLVVFGDSRTWYDGNPYNNKTKDAWQGKTCRGYQQELVDQLGVIVTTEGVSGEDSTQISTRIRAYDFSGFDIVLIEGGVNDFVKGTTLGELAPIGSTFNTSTVYGALQSAVEYILDDYPDIKIYMDIPGIAWVGANDDMFPYETAQVKKHVADLYNIPCADLYRNGGINKINRDYFFADNASITNNWHLHYNDYGNARLGAILAQFINAH